MLEFGMGVDVHGEDSTKAACRAVSEVWKGDIDEAQNFAERLPTEGVEALIDTTDNPTFGKV